MDACPATATIRSRSSSLNCCSWLVVSMLISPTAFSSRSSIGTHIMLRMDMPIRDSLPVKRLSLLASAERTASRSFRTLSRMVRDMRKASSSSRRNLQARWTILPSSLPSVCRMKMKPRSAAGNTSKSVSRIFGRIASGSKLPVRARLI